MVHALGFSLNPTGLGFRLPRHSTAKAAYSLGFRVSNLIAFQTAAAHNEARDSGTPTAQLL